MSGEESDVANDMSCDEVGVQWWYVRGVSWCRVGVVGVRFVVLTGCWC